MVQANRKTSQFLTTPPRKPRRATRILTKAPACSWRDQHRIRCTSSPGVPMWKASATENGLLAPSPSR